MSLQLREVQTEINSLDSDDNAICVYCDCFMCHLKHCVCLSYKSPVLSSYGLFESSVIICDTCLFSSSSVYLGHVKSS